ncbi:MAG: class B sortase [Firmicutes bacterium]|nr:class B sortase [Bacillota bacterium]
MTEITEEKLYTEEKLNTEETTDTTVAEQPAPKKKKKYRINVLRMAIFVICLGVACFSAVKLIGILKEYKKGSDTYSEVEEVAFIPSGHDSSDEPDASESLIPNVDFVALKQISDKAVGWLYSPGTVINYPVAKTNNNDYYLTHLIDGTSNANGCFFVDYRNSDGFTDQNTIIYGHRMKNGAMLSSIAKYNKQEYYDEHPVMYLITPDGKYELQIFSAYITESTSNAYKRTFESDAKFTEWLNNAVRHSYVKTDVKVGPEDHVVTLSTCVKSEDTRRFIALGKLVKIED